MLTLTDDKLFKFVLILGEEKRNFEFFGVFLWCVYLGEKSLAGCEPLLAYYFRHLSIRPLEQTVKFVCSSMNVTNPKNPKAFKMHPQSNKLFQTYQNQLIFRLQVVTTLFKISVNHSTSAWVKFISILLDNTISFYYFAPLSSCSAQKLF